jgi:GMP synthase (glutamine-hydrolysing)
MTHVDSIVELPSGATVLARTELEPHAAVRFGPLAWGVQFHPEFDAAILATSLQTRRADLMAVGIDVDRRLAEVRNTPVAQAVRRFLRAIPPSPM